MWRNDRIRAFGAQSFSEYAVKMKNFIGAKKYALNVREQVVLINFNPIARSSLGRRRSHSWSQP